MRTVAGRQWPVVRQIHEMANIQLQGTPVIATGSPRHEHRHILEVRGVDVRYGSSYALRDVSLQVVRGEQLAVVGPNGAGKSTLFKVVAGVLAPSRGQVTTYARGEGTSAGVAYVPQRSQVDWNFPVSVVDVVMMGRTKRIGLFRRPSASDRARVQAALEAVHMDHLAHRQIGALSGGQQQRVFIARALAQEAEILLLDEPLTGLDFASQEDLFALLDELQRRGATIVVSTHDLSHAAEKFDRVLLLNHQVIGLGEPNQVLTAAKLREAYGGRSQIIQQGEDVIMLGDSHCDGCGQ